MSKPTQSNLNLLTTKATIMAKHIKAPTWTTYDEYVSMYWAKEYECPVEIPEPNNKTPQQWVNYIIQFGRWTPTKATIQMFRRNRRYVLDVTEWMNSNTIPDDATRNPRELQRIYDDYNNDMNTLLRRRREALEQRGLGATDNV